MKTGNIIVCKEGEEEIRVYYSTKRNTYIRYNIDGTIEKFKHDNFNYTLEDVHYVHRITDVNVDLVYEKFIKSFGKGIIIKFKDKSVDEIITAIKTAYDNVKSAQENVDRMLSELSPLIEDQPPLELTLLFRKMEAEPKMLKMLLQQYLNSGQVIADKIDTVGLKYPEHMILTLEYKHGIPRPKVYDANLLFATFSRFDDVHITFKSDKDDCMVYKITNFSQIGMDIDDFIEKQNLFAIGYSFKKYAE